MPCSQGIQIGMMVYTLNILSLSMGEKQRPTAEQALQ